MEVPLFNHSAQPWTPSEATLTSATGKPVTVRSVASAAGEIAPGRKDRVFVEAEVPPPSAGLGFTLELRGADGRRLSIPTVRLPPPGSKP